MNSHRALWNHNGLYIQLAGIAQSARKSISWAHKHPYLESKQILQMQMAIHNNNMISSEI
jgi:hypothetical protein